MELSANPDFNTIAQRFSPDVMTLYEFNGGYYALPLDENFPMMFYRTDVLQEQPGTCVKSHRPFISGAATVSCV